MGKKKCHTHSIYIWCFQTSIYTFSLSAYYFPPGRSGRIKSFSTHTHEIICMTTAIIIIIIIIITNSQERCFQSFCASRPAGNALLYYMRYYNIVMSGKIKNTRIFVYIKRIIYSHMDMVINNMVGFMYLIFTYIILL